MTWGSRKISGERKPCYCRLLWVRPFFVFRFNWVGNGLYSLKNRPPALASRPPVLASRPPALASRPPVLGNEFHALGNGLMC